MQEQRWDYTSWSLFVLSVHKSGTNFMPQTYYAFPGKKIANRLAIGN